MPRVAINGYGTIGKRVADAVRRQPDMSVAGVAKTSPDHVARSALRAGYDLYAPADCADEFADLDLAGTTEEMVEAADVVVDACPGGIGERNRPLYEAHDTPAIFQGAEDADVADVSFTARANYDAARDADSARVVSCNTTGLARLLTPLDERYGVERARVTLVRRGGDPAQTERGPIDDILPDPVSIPSHHGPDVNTVLPDLDIATMGLTVPATRMHVHAINVSLDSAPDREDVLDLLGDESRLFLVPEGIDLEACGKLKELAKDAGRPRGDLWENCLWEESVAVEGSELYCFQAIHQEADVVPENVDAVRALLGTADRAESVARTDEALGIGMGTEPPTTERPPAQYADD